MVQGTVGDAIPAEQLERRAELPLKIAPVTLAGRWVRLEPYDPARDAGPLFAVSNGQATALGERSIATYDADELIWRYMFGGPFTDVDAFVAYMRGQHEAANGLCLTVFDIATDRQVGICNYMTNMPEHLKIELGSIWYSPLVQRTNANLESTYLMLRHAFDLGYRRVEWKCDSLNERSRRAALRMGFQFESIQDAHFIIKNRNRDTAWYRVLDREWPGVKAQIEGMLNG
jgi:RimJ/RimL family protein N-acetyltransferase